MIQILPTNQLALPLPELYIKRLQQTAQNPKFHAEGNVYNHTMMVLEQYYKYIDSYNLSSVDKKTLYWTTILHDLGKMEVTRWVNNKWSSPNHEKAGVPIARDILLSQKDISPSQRQSILNLVRWHHVPLRWGLRNASIETYKLLATQVDLRMLGIFSLFDMLGRECVKKSEVLSLVMHFLEVIVPTIEKEMGTFATIQARFEEGGLRKKNALWTSFQQNESSLIEKVLDMRVENEPPPRGNCVITVGAAKAGKTDYVQSSYSRHIQINVERFNTAFVGEVQWRELGHVMNTHLGKGQDIVLDGTNLDSKVRSKLSNIAKDQNAFVHYLFFERSLDFLSQRNKTYTQPLPQASLQKGHRSVFYPHPWESHSIERV